MEKIICGIKLTHDSSVAIIKGNKLIFSVEFEKIDNNYRHASFTSMSQLEGILNDNGYNISIIDSFVIDGWDNKRNTSKTKIEVGDLSFEVADYGRDLFIGEDLLKRNIRVTNHKYKGITYNSYPHIAGHCMGAYCASRYYKDIEDSYIMVWDGGIGLMLFYYNCKNKQLLYCKNLLELNGQAYPELATFLPEFRYQRVESIAGKVMALNCLTKPVDNLIFEANSIYNEIMRTRVLNSDEFYIRQSNFLLSFYNKCIKLGYNTYEIMSSFDKFIERKIIEEIEYYILSEKNKTKNLCYSGGCALNIKWNSAIRDSGLFKQIFIPPFTDDSGSAIGMACCEMISQTDDSHFIWDVYKGPQRKNIIEINGQWIESKCEIEQLAHIIYTSNEPIVFLQNRLEIGPRALGASSILASPFDEEMIDLLNSIKDREYYRPVAPICLEEDASDIFLPGTPDPFMLFEHKLRGDLGKKFKTITHFDDSSRVQTINFAQNQEVYNLLNEYKKLSGYGILCNTSANRKGCGFFPDIDSVMAWGKVKYIWSNNILYTNKKIKSSREFLNKSLSIQRNQYSLYRTLKTSSVKENEFLDKNDNQLYETMIVGSYQLLKKPFNYFLRWNPGIKLNEKTLYYNFKTIKELIPESLYLPSFEEYKTLFENNEATLLNNLGYISPIGFEKGINVFWCRDTNEANMPGSVLIDNGEVFYRPIFSEINTYMPVILINKSKV